MGTSAATAQAAVKKHGRSGFKEWAEFIGTLFLMVFFIRVTTVEAFRIPTGSMENTLLVGDFLLVNKFVYGVKTPEWLGIPFTDIGFDVPSYRFPASQKVESGDIIVFKYPKDRSQNYIKRCIATPGQTLQIVNRKIFLDGELMEQPSESKYMLPEPVAAGIRERGIFAAAGSEWNHDNYGPIVIPDGKYFMMGDNRDNSHDSRYWGFVDETDIVGKALIIYFSFDKYAGMSEFYNLVRWKRIGSWIE